VNNSLHNSVSGKSVLQSRAPFSSTNSRIASTSTFSNRHVPSLSPSYRRATFGNGFRTGNGRLPYCGGFPGRCWKCRYGGGFGYGWGPGFGFGWPWFGFSYWDPFYWNNLSWGWPGYGFYGYPSINPYGYGYNTFDDNSSYLPPTDNSISGDSSSEPAEPPEQDSIQMDNAPMDNGPNGGAYNAANSAAPVLLYMKSGSVYSARDYWFSDGELHYVLMDGREGTADAEQLDMRRTNEENAKSGVPFVVKSDPI
jgi:hypothetical protein